MKLAMIELDKRLTSGTPGKLLMQVHDELVLEVPANQADELTPVLREVLEGVFNLRGVKLKVDIHQGANWADAKD